MKLRAAAPVMILLSMAAPATPLPASGAATPATPDLAASSNQLAFDLHRSLAGQPGNVAFSPASIFVALLMPWSGARGETAAEMGRVLHLQGASEAVVPAAGALLRTLNDPART